MELIGRHARRSTTATHHSVDYAVSINVAGLEAVCLEAPLVQLRLGRMELGSRSDGAIDHALKLGALADSQAHTTPPPSRSISASIEGEEVSSLALFPTGNDA